MKKLLAIICVLYAALELSAQGFNGSLEFKYTTQKDTTSNVYHVKNKLVKLDQFSKKTNAIEGSFIFDLGASKIKWVNPKRKVWGEHMSETPPVIRGTCEVIKGTSNRQVAGYKCRDYTVKNSEENISITYWIAESKFDFFMPLIRLWNRKDRQSVYFNQIKDLPEGSMPLMSEEKQLTEGKLLSKLEVIKINAKMPDDAALAVPAGYTKFDQ